MKKYLVIFLTLIVSWTPIFSLAETYELSQKVLSISWPKGDWNGRHALPPLYCVNFESPKDVKEMTLAIFNRNSISLSRVAYKDDTSLYIVTSTIPKGRTPEEDIIKLLKANRRNAESMPAYVKVDELVSPFGLTVGMTIRNSREGDITAPFPLAYSMTSSTDGQISSISMHRLFARGPDRFEIALLKIFPASISADEEREQVGYLTARIESAVNEMFKCTSQMPIRELR